MNSFSNISDVATQPENVVKKAMPVEAGYGSLQKLDF